MDNFSPNMLKTFDACPKKYYFKYIRKISVPQKASFFEKGKKVHALAHYYLNGNDISKTEKALTEDEKIIWERLKNNIFFQKEYVNSEYNLFYKIDNYLISGRLDALMKENNDYFILDYKTGSVPINPENDYQTMVYMICTDKILKNYNSLKFIYIDLKNNKNYEINFDDNLKTNYQNSLNLICRKIKNFRFEAEFKHTDKCAFCEYNKICC